MKFFISYSSKDRDAADYIAAQLVDRGVSVFIDYESLRGGDDFPERLANEIIACTGVIFLLSQHSTVSRWVQKEIQFAFSKDKPILPVRLDSTVLPPSLFFLEFTHMTDFAAWRNPDDGMAATQKLMAALNLRAPYLDAPTLAAIERAWHFNGKYNGDWQPYFTSFADLRIPTMLFCLVPVGSFIMGNDEGQFNERPAHIQLVRKPYWIAKYPVTNHEWRLAVEAGAVDRPIEIRQSLDWYQDPKRAMMPVVGVTWFMAHEFAQWLGGFLPNELEWEYAARGVESWQYPWGNDWDESIPIWSRNSGGTPASVSAKPEGRSWVDACHLSGNVWEWTSSVHRPYPFRSEEARKSNSAVEINALRTIRGGSCWMESKDLLRASYRSTDGPDNREYLRGFRIARAV